MWKKLGLVFCPEGTSEWMSSHATVPTPYHLHGDLWRIYFSTRDSSQRNQVGYVEVEIAETVKVCSVSQQPVIPFGKLGYFDCDGVYATSLVKHRGLLYFYYAGWNAGRDGIFYSAIGLAISEDNGLSFRKYTNAPVLGRDRVDKWAVMAPFVQKLAEDNWLMLYTSGIELYHDKDGQVKSLYDVKSAYSQDGLEWFKTGETAIGLEEKDTNIARACFGVEDGKFKAFYPYVSKALGNYRIGYAESADGLHYTRKDEHNLASSLCVGPTLSWDSDAVTYPHVFEHKGKFFMLYNGNGFGKTGFGMAVWQE